MSLRCYLCCIQVIIDILYTSNFEIMNAKLKKIQAQKKELRGKNKGNGKKGPEAYGFKLIHLPADVIEKMRIVTLAYRMAWSEADWKNMNAEELAKIKLPALTMGDVVVHLIDNAALIDPEIKKSLKLCRGVNGNFEALRDAYKAQEGIEELSQHNDEDDDL